MVIHIEGGGWTRKNKMEAGFTVISLGIAAAIIFATHPHCAAAHAALSSESIIGLHSAAELGVKALENSTHKSSLVSSWLDNSQEDKHNIDSILKLLDNDSDIDIKDSNNKKLIDYNYYLLKMYRMHQILKDTPQTPAIPRAFPHAGRPASGCGPFKNIGVECNKKSNACCMKILNKKMTEIANKKFELEHTLEIEDNKHKCETCSGTGYTSGPKKYKPRNRPGNKRTQKSRVNTRAYPSMVLSPISSVDSPDYTRLYGSELSQRSLSQRSLSQDSPIGGIKKTKKQKKKNKPKQKKKKK